MEKREIFVSAALFREDDRFRMFQRGYGSSKGKWEFPGGKQEAGESAEEALIRELREELGVSCAVDGLFCQLREETADTILHFSFFFSHILQGEFVLKEHLASCIDTPERLLLLPLCDADRHVVERMAGMNG